MNFLPSIFKTRKPKQFSLATRYYDADKEELEQRVAQKTKEVQQTQASKEEVQVRISQVFQSRRRSNRQVNSIQLILVGILVVMCWLYFYYEDYAVYGFVMFIPVYFYIKYRLKNRN